MNTQRSPVYFADLTPRQRAELLTWTARESLPPDADVRPVVERIAEALAVARRVFDEARPKKEGDAALYRAAYVCAHAPEDVPVKFGLSYGQDEIGPPDLLLWTALALVDYFENPWYQGINPYMKKVGVMDLGAGYVTPRPDRFPLDIARTPAVLAVLTGDRAPGNPAFTSTLSAIDVAEAAVELVTADTDRYVFTGRPAYAGGRAAARYPRPLVTDLAERFGVDPATVRRKLDAAGLTTEHRWGPLVFSRKQNHGRPRAHRPRKK